MTPTSRATRAHSSIGQSPRLITGLFLVRTQVGPQAHLHSTEGPQAHLHSTEGPQAHLHSTEGPQAHLLAPLLLEPCRKGQRERFRLKAARALCTFVPRFLHRPGVTH